MMFRRVLTIALVLTVAFMAGLAIRAEGPKYGGKLAIAIGTDPESFDPIRIASAPAGMIFEHMVESLFTITEEGEIVPLLAERYWASSDGLVYIIWLRKGITFHDGTPFDAEAVKINLDRFLDPANAAPYRFLIDKVTQIEVVDEHIVYLKLSTPFAPIIPHLTHRFIGMVSPKALEGLAAGQTIDRPVGTGPFIFKEWIRGERVVLVKNPNYWGPKAYLDELVFLIIPEDATRVVMLETGEIHATMRIPPPDIPRLKAAPGIEIVEAPSVRTIYIGLNNLWGPLADRQVRQAINYAVDKEEIVKSVLLGVGRVSDAPISPGIFGYTAATPYPYDPAKARQLLADAGYPQGFKVKLWHPTGRYMMDAQIAEAVQAQLRGVGIEAELVTMEWAAYLAAIRKPPEKAPQEMVMLGWGCVTMDADYGLYPMFHSSQWPPVGWAITFYKSDQLDQLLDQARVTIDVGARLNLYDQAIKVIWEDAPWLFLYSELQVNGVRANVKGLVHHPREGILAHQAWIE